MTNFWILAGHGHRVRADKAEVAGNLVVGDLASAEGLDVVHVSGLARAQSDPGAQLLAEPLGHQDDPSFRHGELI